MVCFPTRRENSTPRAPETPPPPRHPPIAEPASTPGPISGTTQRSPRSAENQIPHRPVPAHRGVVLGRFSYARRHPKTFTRAVVRAFLAHAPKPTFGIVQRVARLEVVSGLFGLERARHETRHSPGQNDRTESSHKAFRRREQSMLRLRRFRGLQKFASRHAAIMASPWLVARLGSPET